MNRLLTTFTALLLSIGLVLPGQAAQAQATTDGTGAASSTNTDGIVVVGDDEEDDDNGADASAEA
ncbi:MAG: hypothetical protein BRD33_05100, partial [Bacteroidetes bacterium QH_6_63_17]